MKEKKRTLASRVSDLEKSYEECSSLLGEVLATLTIPKNREHLMTDEFFKIVESWVRQFKAIPEPS